MCNNEKPSSNDKAIFVNVNIILALKLKKHNPHLRYLVNNFGTYFT